MQYRKLGNKKDVSILGYGAMRLPILNGNDSQIDKKLATQQIHYAIEKGVNYIDTAYTYHQKNSEKFIAEVLSNGIRDKVYIATKLPVWKVNNEKDFYTLLDEQLSNLNTDHIDFYLLHSLNKKFWDRCLEHNVFKFLDYAKNSGKVHNIGFSFHDEIEVFKTIIDAYNWDFCQIQFNYLDINYQAGLDGLMYASNKNIDVVVMEPLRGGKLAKNIPNVVQNIFDKSNYKYSPAAWSFKYIWNFPQVSTVLSGMNDFYQIDDNINTASNASPNSLSKEELNTINKLREAYSSLIKVGCTSCNYCMPCPYGVNIPANFKLYNNSNMFNDLKSYKKQYDEMKDLEHSFNCEKCGECESKCPQKIQIRKELENVSNYFG